jgi:hypothetical protein
MWDVGCGMWDVGCGMWDVKRESGEGRRRGRVLEMFPLPFAIIFLRATKI